MTSIKPIDSTTFQDDPVLAVFSKQEKKYCFASLIIIFLSSAIFGLWFKVKQLSIASPEIIRFYPVTGYIFAVLQTLLLFVVLWLGLVLVCRFIGRDKGVATNMLASSLPFTVFMLSVFEVPLPVQFRLFLVSVVILFFLKVLGNRSFLEEIKEPITVLILFFLVYLFVYKSLSPLFSSGFFDVHGRTDFLANFDHQWENAKAYDFLGNFSQHSWLGGFTQGVYVMSELLSLIVLLLDIPLVDDLSKHGVATHLYFYFYIFGSYGCYFFLRQGLKLSLLPSFIGGLGFIFGNVSLLSFWGAEWTNYQGAFIFVPWIFFLLKLAYDLDKPIFLCAGGMVASLSEYAWSSHPETNLGSLLLCNSYNLYLAFIRLAKDRYTLKSVGRFFKCVFLFPFFHTVGLAYKFIPLFEALMAKEYALIDIAIQEQGSTGLLWPGDLKHYSTFFFRFEDTTKVLPTDLGSFGSPMWGGVLVYFYTGQFAVLMIFCLIFYFFSETWRRLFKKNENSGPSDLWESVSYFPLMFLLMVWVLPMGNKSWLSQLMAWTGFMRIHYFNRVEIYYYFVALVSAMCGFEYVLRQKKLSGFNVLFGAYLLTLAGIYFSPMRMAIPDQFLLDGGILLATYFSIAFLIKSYSLFKSEKSAISYQALSRLTIIGVAFFSFLTVNTRCNIYVTQKANPEIESADRMFISFRTQIAHLRNHQHDSASIKYLEQRLERFKDYLYTRDQQGFVSSAAYDKITGFFREFYRSDQEIRDQFHESKQNQESLFGKSDRIRDMEDRLLANKLRFFETIAPEVDSFYLANGSWAAIAANPAFWGTLSFGAYNGMQYYLPDKYQLYAFLHRVADGVLQSIGKNSDLMEKPFYYSTVGYPSISVSFHLRSLFRDALGGIDTEGAGDYNNVGLDLDVATYENAKKVLDIIGVDHMFFWDYHLREQPSPSQTLDSFKSMGLVSVELPESSKFTGQQPSTVEAYRMHMVKNPQSYGKAYVARWVKTMKPEENMMNLDMLHLPLRRSWPRSKELIENFEFNWAKIPKDVHWAALIESSDPGDYSESPRNYKSNNDVNIVKIIGSKAVFDVDCEDENCWFVYNTAFLKGWEAFSGSTPLPIHKANLGFIGVKLNKGKHLVWMEYRPFSRTLGFIVMLSGWLCVLFAQFFRLYAQRSASSRR